MPKVKWFKRVSKSGTETERIIEKLRIWQIVLGLTSGLILAFSGTTVRYVDDMLYGPVACNGSISITYPENKSVVYGDEIDVAGVVNPREGCQNVFLLVAAMEGHNYFSTDAVTINPDGTWDATAKLHFVPQGTRARIQARLCGEHDAYPPEACLPEMPNKGVASNSVIISRRAGLPKLPHEKTTRSSRKRGTVKLHLLEFNNVFASGYITGFDRKTVDQLKVVIYYEDKKFGWVKQPYPGNGRGYGWAAVLPTGEWSIALKERPSDKMQFIGRKAILLMSRDYKSPDRTKDLSELHTLDKIIKDVE